MKIVKCVVGAIVGFFTVGAFYCLFGESCHIVIDTLETRDLLNLDDEETDNLRRHKISRYVEHLKRGYERVREYCK